jgi:hypothetical protein
VGDWPLTARSRPASIGSTLFFPTPRHIAYLEACKVFLEAHRHPSLAGLGQAIGVTKQTVWQLEQNSRFRQWLRMELTNWRQGMDGNSRDGWEFNLERASKRWRQRGRPPDE